MIKKIDISDRINSNIEEIFSSDLLLPAIHEHYEKFKIMYSTDPGFYKFLVKKNRFIPSTIIAINAYCTEKTLISDVIKKCLALNILSINSIYSLIDYLCINKVINKNPSHEDKRKQDFSFTAKGENGLINLIATLMPAIHLFKNKSINLTDGDGVKEFLNRYKDIIDSGLVFLSDIENIDIFIDKNAGHFILLYIFCNQQDNKFTGSISKLSGYCDVSRTHISRTINEAIDHGLLLKNDLGEIIILPEFTEMTKKYMATQLVFAMYGLDCM